MEVPPLRAQGKCTSHTYQRTEGTSFQNKALNSLKGCFMHGAKYVTIIKNLDSTPLLILRQ